MKEFKLKGKEDFIKLGQLLKAVGMVSAGIEAKIVIQDGFVKVNDEVEVRRGKKLYDGDYISYNNESIIIKNS